MTVIVGPVRVVWSWADETGAASNPRAHYPQSQIDDAAAAAVELSAAAAALSECVINGFSLNYRVANPGTETSGGQSVKVVGVLVFDCDGDEERLFYEQPGLKANLISVDPPMVDVPNDAPVIQAIAAEIIAGGWCNPNGVAATELIAVLWRQDT